MNLIFLEHLRVFETLQHAMLDWDILRIGLRLKFQMSRFLQLTCKLTGMGAWGPHQNSIYNICTRVSPKRVWWFVDWRWSQQITFVRHEFLFCHSHSLAHCHSTLAGPNTTSYIFDAFISSWGRVWYGVMALRVWGHLGVTRNTWNLEKYLSTSLQKHEFWWFDNNLQLHWSIVT